MTRVVDMTGERFGECIVIGREGSNKDKKATWKCLCYCGVEFVTTGKSIRLGYAKSCGCFRKMVLSKQGKKNITHNESKSRLYGIWRGMKKRCKNPSDTSYRYYGAKGIEYCGAWEEYEAFRDWSFINGYQEHLTLDRLDNDKGYYPDNCEWSTWHEQARNRSNNVIVEHGGIKKTLSEVAEDVGESREMIWYRHHNDIPYDEPKRIFVKSADL